MVGRSAGRHRRRRRTRRRRGGVGRRAAARHGVPGRRRRGGSRCVAVERHSIQRRRRRARSTSWAAPAEWAKRIGVVPVAAITVDQAALARRPRTRSCRCDGGGVPAARLADLAADADRPTSATCAPTAATPAEPGTSPPRPTATSPTCSNWRCGDDGPRCRRCWARTTSAGQTSTGAVLGPGAGDNAAAALGLGAGPGDCVVSLGTSGVVSAVGEAAPHDPEGIVAGFADATGRQLPLVCTLNGAPVLAAVATMLGVDFDELDRLALLAPAGAEGLTLVPYFEGERSPNLPDAAGALHGVTTRNLDLRQRRPRRGGGLAGFDGVLHRQDRRAGRRRRAHHPGRRWRALGGRPAHRPGDLGQAGACADAGGVRGAGCGPASGMDAVAGGFAAAMVVRGDGLLYRREPTPQVLDQYRAAQSLTLGQ